ncbi:MAG: M48 family metallopeptidase, partial [Bacillota bacterium]
MHAACIERGGEIQAAEEGVSLNCEPSLRLKALWIVLTTLGLGLIFLLLFATLEQRPLDMEALRYFPAEMLERGRRFTREARLAGTLQALATVGLLLLLCFSAAGARLLKRLEAIGRGRPSRELACVVVGVGLLSALVEFPFAFYLGYLHEKAYGLTRISPGAWLGEHLLGLGVSTVLSVLFWLPLYWLIRRSSRHWWLPATGVTALFGGLLAMLYPVLLLPLFNQVTPVKDPQVIAMIERMANRAGVEVGKVREIRVSEKSSRLNAMVTGIGPTKQVVLYNTLYEMMSLAEVEVVLAHELAHAVHGDVVTGWVVGSGLGAVSLALAAWLLREMREVAPLNLPAPHAARGLAVLILFFTLFDTVAAPIQNGVSRQMEVRADRYALRLTQNPRAVVTSFQKLAAANPSDVAPPPLVELLSYSHPSILNRIRLAL